MEQTIHDGPDIEYIKISLSMGTALLKSNRSHFKEVFLFSLFCVSVSLIKRFIDKRAQCSLVFPINNSISFKNFETAHFQFDAFSYIQKPLTLLSTFDNLWADTENEEQRSK